MDAVQEEGVLLDALLLQVVLKSLEQLAGHLECHRSLVSAHRSFLLLIVVKCLDQPGHILAQCFSGYLLLLPHPGVKPGGDGCTEVLHIFFHGLAPLLFGNASISIPAVNSHHQQQQRLCRKASISNNVSPPPPPGRCPPRYTPRMALGHYYPRPCTGRSPRRRAGLSTHPGTPEAAHTPVE